MERSQMMSPDTVSSLFPDRPIRPLPRRRIRERLSTEAAGSVAYPFSTRSSLPLFYYPPFSLKDESSSYTNDVLESSTVASVGDAGQTEQAKATHRSEGGDELAQNRSLVVSRSRADILTRISRESIRQEPTRQEQTRQVESQVAQLQHSASSSVDGYDSFENTNNKKKRKIPSAGHLSANGTHGLNSEVNALALSAVPTTANNESHHQVEHIYHGASGCATSKGYGANNQGISGSGRGRLGRSRNGRSPLRTLPDGNNAWLIRGAKAGTMQWSPAHVGGGIISSAIANAEKLPPQGQENVSLLEQHIIYPKTTPSSAQFTFTCDSQVPGTVQWPADSVNCQDIPRQTSDMSASMNADHTLNTDAASGAPTQSRRKSRRRLEKELVAAARRRKDIARHNFYQNPPKPDGMWICEFCEYERIFGVPPVALIREYEMKDRRQRLEEAERKRLLEKAKAKSRKSRKNGKAPIKGNLTGHSHDEHNPSDLADDEEALPIRQGHCHLTQHEEKYSNAPKGHCDDSLPEHGRPPNEGASNVGRSRAKT